MNRVTTIATPTQARNSKTGLDIHAPSVAATPQRVDLKPVAQSVRKLDRTTGICQPRFRQGGNLIMPSIGPDCR